MASKSAAKVKLVKKDGMDAAPERDPREYFEEAVEGMKVIVTAARRKCHRIDNLVDVWNEMRDWGMDPDVSKAVAVCNAMSSDYDTMLEVIEGLRYEDFAKEDMEDPVLPFIPDALTAVVTVEDMYDAYTSWRVMRPIGEKVEQLHMAVLDSLPEEEPEEGSE